MIAQVACARGTAEGRADPTSVMTFNYLRPVRAGMLGPAAATHYDGLLAAVPASVAGGAAASWLLAVPFAFGIGAGSFLAALLVGVSLFVVPPQ